MESILIFLYILPWVFLPIVIYNFYRFVKGKKQQKAFANVQYQSDGKRLIEQYANEYGIRGDISSLPTEQKFILVNRYLKKRVNRRLTYSILSVILFLLFSAYSLFLIPKGSSENIPKDNLEQLVKGKIAYDIPDTMRLEQDYRAIVSITQAQSDSILLEGLNSTDFEIERITISSRVKASLVDPTNINFDINPLSSEEQLVDDSTNTTWRWNIRPRKSGNNVLMLKVSIKVKNRIGETPKDILVFDKPFFVESSITTEAKNIFGDYWQWFTTVLIIPIFLWLRNIYITRKKNKKNTREPIGFKKSGS